MHKSTSAEHISSSPSRSKSLDTAEITSESIAQLISSQRTSLRLPMASQDTTEELKLPKLTIVVALHERVREILTMKRLKAYQNMEITQIPHPIFGETVQDSLQRFETTLMNKEPDIILLEANYAHPGNNTPTELISALKICYPTAHMMFTSSTQVCLEATQNIDPTAIYFHIDSKTDGYIEAIKKERDLIDILRKEKMNQICKEYSQSLEKPKNVFSK